MPSDQNPNASRHGDPGAGHQAIIGQTLRESKLGGVDSYPTYPVAWAQVSNTPFRFFKRTPMNGGIRVPLLAHWPARLQDGGAFRRQWVQRHGTAACSVTGVDQVAKLNMSPTFLRVPGEGMDVGLVSWVASSLKKQICRNRRQARRKTQRYRVVSRGFATLHGVDSRWICSTNLEFRTLDRKRKVSPLYDGRGIFEFSGRITCVTVTPGPQAPDSIVNRPETLAQLD